MPQYQKVAIVGVGLLGGSIGLALRKLGLANLVYGVGRNPQTLGQAQSLGAITHSDSRLEAACDGADLVLVCTPVQSIVHYVQGCLNCNLSPECLITDVGSTKVGICQTIPAAGHSHFCGSHPMAGSDRSGVQHASADLFEKRLTIVTPTAWTPPSLAARTEAFWQSLGCRTIQLPALEHDQAMAQVSHLPHLVASALASVTDASLLPLTGPGWQDTTRIAAGSVELWQQIVAENRQPILEALRGYSNQLQTWIAALESGDDRLLSELLKSGKDKRDLVSKTFTS